ncbi:hypothetical protein CPB85DRAFT_1437833 [Mucidula mucida]|nr:hypothetical protein CPB85DRAFT_1437833 [Mucidula mucida]
MNMPARYKWRRCLMACFTILSLFPGWRWRHHQDLLRYGRTAASTLPTRAPYKEPAGVSASRDTAASQVVPEAQRSDYAYRPPHEEDDEPSSSAYISPRRNIQWKEDVKLEARQAVIDHSVHGLSCAICGCDNNDGISYNMAHVLDRSLAGNEELVAHLEHSWGLEPKTFYLHSRFNMMILCVKCHSELDKRLFGLLPSTQTIDVVVNFAEKTPEARRKRPVSQLFKHDPENPLKYRVVDIAWKGKNPFVVYLPGKNNRSRLKGIFPPFRHPLLSNIELHVNPVYMIWNLGLKLQGIDVNALDVPKWQRADLLRVSRLFESWQPEGKPVASGSGSGTSKAAGPAPAVAEAAIQSVASTSEEDAATSEPRRSKRLRAASTAHDSDSTLDVPPPPKRSKKGKSAATASRR